MKKLLVLTGVLLTLIVLYPKKTGEIFRDLKTTIFSHFYSDTVKGDDLVKRNGLYYKKHTDVPFTGKEEIYFKDGQLKSKGYYKDGEKDGLFEHYHGNGRLKSKEHYKDGKDEGVWETYYENGQLKSKGHYKDRKKDGFWEEYYENGVLDDLW